jgi:hypothetical protein
VFLKACQRAAAVVLARRAFAARLVFMAARHGSASLAGSLAPQTQGPRRLLRWRRRSACRLRLPPAHGSAGGVRAPGSPCWARSVGRPALRALRDSGPPRQASGRWP